MPRSAASPPADRGTVASSREAAVDMHDLAERVRLGQASVTRIVARLDVAGFADTDLCPSDVRGLRGDHGRGARTVRGRPLDVRGRPSPGTRPNGEPRSRVGHTWLPGEAIVTTSGLPAGGGEEEVSYDSEVSRAQRADLRRLDWMSTRRAIAWNIVSEGDAGCGLCATSAVCTFCALPTRPRQPLRRRARRAAQWRSRSLIWAS
ncbi:hypothetical protein GCM10010294_47770 [Streptomyces griseoloalbus]|nr:hypothetical protein GCM10010294_47770 [Streptomyces griseoloalbus]